MGGPSTAHPNSILIFSHLPRRTNEQVLKIFWVICILGCCFYLFLGISAPLLSYIAYSEIDYIYKIGRKLCTARPSRCIWILNDHTALCAKCMGFYLGVSMTALIAMSTHKIKHCKIFGITSFSILLIVIFHSIYRAAYGGLLFTVWLSGILGFVAGIALVLSIWSVFSKWEEKAVKVLRKSWLIAITIILGINLLGFASAFAAPARVQPDEIKVPSGTPVILEVETGFATDEVREGDAVALIVQRPVYVDRVLVVRQGVAARAKVLSAKSASGWGGAGEIGIAIRSVQAVDGSEIMLAGRSTRKGEAEHGAATAVGVGAGLLCLPLAVVGFAVQGEEGKFPMGYEIVAHTTGDHFVQLLPEDKLENIEKEQKETARRVSEKFKNRMEELRKKKAEEERRRNEQM